MNYSFIVAVILALFLSVGGLTTYLNITKKPSFQSIELNDEEQDYKKAVTFFKGGQFHHVIDLIKKNRNIVREKQPGWEKWIALFIEVSSQTENAKQLVILNQEFPQFFLANEKASLAVASELVNYGRISEYLLLRSNWDNKKKNELAWTLIDVDYLILEGKRSQAMHLLESKEFEGGDETERLLTLFYMCVHDQPEKAKEYLTLAWEKDPQNADLLCLRAGTSEKAGNENEAFSDYILASALFPFDLCVRENLIDYLIRSKNYPQAMDVIEEAISDLEVSNDLILKALFWSKVVKPLDIKIYASEIPEDEKKSLIQYLSHLKPEQFWNWRTFESLKNKKDNLANTQEVYWLQLIEELKSGTDTQAMRLLSENPFSKQSWNPELENVLKQILLARLRQNSFSSPQHFLDEKGVQFLSTLYKHRNEAERKLSLEDIQHVARSPLIFSICFLAAGWNHAAIQLLEKNSFEVRVPDWLNFGYAQAVRSCFGDRQALAFIEQQPKFPQLSLLRNEILLDLNEVDRAFFSLGKLSQREDEVGVKAAWMLTLIHIQRGDYVAAKQLIDETPKLKKSALGVDALARIATAEGELSKAKQLFRSIENESIEARFFLAKNAFFEKKWGLAQELTLKLLKEHPANRTLQNNLLKIFKAEHGERLGYN